MPFTFTPLSIPEIILVKPRVFPDDRGFFLETYQHATFVAAGIPDHFVQTNHSHSTREVLRGLHYQKQPAAQGKLLMVTCGEIFDVAVDIRRGSPTYGRWVGQVLSSDNHYMLYVPPGFAHGFCVLSEEMDLIYQVTSEYSVAHERGIIWNDPTIGVGWPVETPILSLRDTQQPCLQDADNNFVYEERG
ncbi:MAG: dTDP-4-dehydrorhamnose 3,5-epimerase [Anaerolineae bacterium]|nr:dTDP-4-dehydrorhamnose 3,5-epimerase [Anaerolineae bacterium]